MENCLSGHVDAVHGWGGVRRIRLYENLTCAVIFFFQAEDGIRDVAVTGVQTCALPIYAQGRVVQKHEGLHDPVLYEVEIRSLLGLPIGNVKVETFEDTGQIFLKHADRATQLPGVDLSKLTPEQRTVALHKFNAEGCTCGCQYTLAQCRIWDRNCAISKATTEKIVDELLGIRHTSADSPSPVKPAAPATPNGSAKPASSSPAKPSAPEKQPAPEKP